MRLRLNPAWMALLCLSGCETLGGAELARTDSGPALDHDGDDGDASGAPSDASKQVDAQRDAPPLPTHDAAVDASALTPVCTLDAGLPLPLDACQSELCSMNGETWLLLSRPEPWTVGGFDWVAAACDQVLGWPPGRSPDGRSLVFGLSPAEAASLAAGAPVLVGWGNPQERPSYQRMHCAMNGTAPLRACPIPPPLSEHESFQGCRGPADEGCAQCRQTGASGTSRYLSASEGSSWYNQLSSEAGACRDDSCPSCASCSYHDQEAARLLERRDECRPCPADTGLDPCFAPGSCACWCSRYEALRAACPTLVSW